jgi:hypothetical protein
VERDTHDQRETGVTDDGLSRRRDAGLAAVATVGVCVAAGVVAGVPAGVRALLSRPPALAAGVVGAFLLELGFARFPRLGRRLWRRRAVRWSGTAVVGVVVPAVAVRAPTVAAPLLATLAGGLVGYAALFLGITSGLLSDPGTWFERA